MGIKTRPGCFSYDDFCSLVREDQKADLIDGVIYMASPENIHANSLFLWLSSIISIYVEEKQLGQVFGSRVACRLDERNSPEPDILFVRNERSDCVQRGGVKGAPDLAMEIVSPESVERDYEEKRKQYQRSGVGEYWIIDEEKTAVLLLRLDGRRRYREVKPRAGILHSEVFEWFLAGSQLALATTSSSATCDPPAIHR